MLVYVLTILIPVERSVFKTYSISQELRLLYLKGERGKVKVQGGSVAQAPERGRSLFTPREKSCFAGTSPDINFIKCLLPCIVINVINDCACYYNYGYCYYCSPYLVLFYVVVISSPAGQRQNVTDITVAPNLF